MPGPKVFPCGQPGQPACPPEPASTLSDNPLAGEPVLYTLTEMQKYGHDCFLKGWGERGFAEGINKNWEA